MKQPIIYWFRNDLRLHDSIALSEAIQSNHPVCFVYIINEAWLKKGSLGFKRISSFRLEHITNSLTRLNNDLRQKDAELHVFKGNPVDILTKLAHHTKAKAIYAHHEFALDEIIEEQEIQKTIPLHLFWGNMVYPPSHVTFEPQTSPYYYTRFMKKVITLRNTPVLTEINTINHYKAKLPFKQENLHDSDSSNSPLYLMNEFIHSDAFVNYHITRELFEGDHYSSFLSPYLADGSLSPNVFYQELNNILADNQELEPSVTKLKQQLIWRDYYRFLFLRYGNKLFYRHGLRKKNRERYDDKEAFDKWVKGRTDHPLINAFMKELRSTGFLSNRGRMLVAYYLSKVMQVNWLWGAAWFEYILIDYDVCNNYGNWAYQAGVGTDSRFNRSFNLDKQMQKFDPDGHYINKWTY